MAHQLPGIPVQQVMDVRAVEPASTRGVDPYGRNPHPSLLRATPEGGGLDIAIGHRPLAPLQHTPTDQQAGFGQRVVRGCDETPPHGIISLAGKRRL